MRKRPLAVWMILGVFVVLTTSMILTYSHRYFVVHSPSHRAARIPLRNSLMDKGLRALVTGLALVAAIQLFRLRVNAVTLFLIAALTRIAVTLYDLTSIASSRRITIILPIALVSVAFYLFCFGYSMHLRSKGGL